MDDRDQPHSPGEFERQFFGAEQAADLGTADLDQLASTQASRILKPIIFLLLLSLSGLTAWQFVGNARYYFAPDAVAPLGDAEDIGNTIRSGTPSPNLRSHRFVSLSGIPQRHASAGDKEVFKLIGAQIYVAQESTTAPGPLTNTFGDADNPDENREEFVGSGWLISFSDLPRKYAGIRDFYAENYRVPFCSHEPSPQLAAYFEAERERTGTLDCVEGYLLIQGETPPAQWPYVIGLMVYGVALTTALFRMAQSMRRRSPH